MSRVRKVESKVVKIEKRKRSTDSEFDFQIEQVSKKLAMTTTVVNFIGKIEHFTASDDFKDYMERM